MTNTKSSDDVTPKSNVEHRALRVELWLFVLMLALAIAGVGITQTLPSGGKLYWLFLLLVYATVSLVLDWRRHAREGRPVWPMIRAQVLHWLGAFVAVNIVLFFESVDIASRGAAADYTLIVLALSCYLAGVHLNWAYLPLSGILAVTAVGLGYLDQLSLFTLLIPLAVLAVWIFIKHRLKTSAGA